MAPSETGPADEDRIVVFSDYVCPFCHLGREALETALEGAEDPPPVVWRPFDLRGIKRRDDGTLDDTVDTGKDEAYFEQVRQNVEAMQERYGVDMVDLDEVQGVDSWNALKASLRVRDREPDTFPAFHDALFEALWVEGRDVGDPEVIADVAGSVGLDGETVAEAAADPAAEEALREALEAGEELGVRAVPTFIIGDRPVQGAAPPDQLRRVIEDL